MRKYGFAVFLWQLILIAIISYNGEFDSFRSRLVLLMTAMLASSWHLSIN